MDAATEVADWLDTLPGNQRTQALRRRHDAIAALLRGTGTGSWVRILQILADNPIKVDTVRRFLEEGFSPDEIAIGAGVYYLTQEEAAESGTWGPTYDRCMQIARAFPDDVAGDIFALLLRYREYLHIKSKARSLPAYASVATGILEIAEANSCRTVGDAVDLIESLIEEAQLERQDMVDVTYEERIDRWRRPAPADLAANWGGFEDDDLGDL